jgi:predicted transglutaminase-like cysteine proteinase
MLARSTLRACARLAAVIGLLVLCAGGTMAKPATVAVAEPTVVAPPVRIEAAERQELRLASLDPADMPANQPFDAAPAPAPAIEGPFGLGATARGPLSARWNSLQKTIALEGEILARCRANPAICTAAAAKFLAVIEAGRAREGRARIGTINRAVNLAIRYTSDLAQYGALDIWATPLMSFASGAGDCEDYAIAKYVALHYAGVAAADLRLVLVHDRSARQEHMVAAARVDGHWLILDNRTMRLVADREVPDLTPLAALGRQADAPALAATPQPSEPPAEAWDLAGLPLAL